MRRLGLAAGGTSIMERPEVLGANFFTVEVFTAIAAAAGRRHDAGRRKRGVAGLELPP